MAKTAIEPRWAPHVTVATLVEDKGKFLMVKEQPDGKTVYNQPAGHLDEGEGLIEAAIRETLEETAWLVDITGYLGLFRYIAPNGTTYLRHGFVGKALKHYPDRALDTPIIEACWMNYEELLANEGKHRSSLVKQLVDNYLIGLIYPLTLFHEPT